MFLKNAWYVAATQDELDSKLLGRTLLNEPVVLFRSASGKPAALEDRCCHRNAPLSLGYLKDGNVRCGYHGLLFDGTGACIEVPSQTRVPPDAEIRSYPVVERNGWIWIWMGDPSSADDSRIPDMFWHDSPEWLPIDGYFHVKCHYQGLIDIQLDQTHSPYVHPDSLGSTAKLKVSPKVTREERAVRCERIYENSEAPALWAAAGNIDGPADGWTKWRFLPPAAIEFDVGWQAVDAPEDHIPLRIRNSHAITPETESTSHHFWVSARNFRLDDPALTEKLGSIRKTFSEDIAIVEATQRNNERFPEAPVIDVNADNPTIQARRLVAHLIEEERGRIEAA